MDTDLAENLARVRMKISQAALAAGRDPEQVRLLAVTKGMPASIIEQALASGITDVGENRVQEGREKWVRIGDAARWHFIGHLQTNKVKYILKQYIMLHSLDRMSLARELSRRLSREGLELDCLVQVNVAGDDAKHGLAPGEAPLFVEEVGRLPGIRVVGLMTMPPFVEDPEESRPHFRRLRCLAEEIERRACPGVRMSELSMGMSADYTVAVAEGSTIVRVGSAIFRGDDE